MRTSDRVSVWSLRYSYDRSYLVRLLVKSPHKVHSSKFRLIDALYDCKMGKMRVIFLPDTIEFRYIHPALNFYRLKRRPTRKVLEYVKEYLNG